MNWAQLKAILWLRWRLTRNQWFRGSGTGGALAMIAAMCGLTLSFGLFAGGVVAGAMAFRDASASNILLTWDVITAFFLVAWTIGLLTELQRSETIDLRRLMHLPVALGQIFLINYAASHLTLVLVTTFPAMIGLGIGLAFGRSPLFLLLLPLIVSFVFMVTAWTYCLRGWLATMMTNPRRRRTIIMCLTLVIIGVVQVPNLYFNVFANRERRSSAKESPEDRTKRRATERAAKQELFAKLASAQKFIPPFWLPVGAHAVAGGNPWPALAATLGCAALGALGLRRAYRGTVRFYHGETDRRTAVTPPLKTPAAVAAISTKSARRRMVELRLRGIPEPAAALGVATFQSMLRAPEVKMAWGTSVIVMVVLGGMTFMKSAPNWPEVAKPFVATGAVTFTLFMLLQFVGNQFGLDRNGFRALVLAPVDRRHLLLGKNLANVPIAATLGLVLVAASSIWLAIPWEATVAAVFQLTTLILLMSIYGNLLSILIPYRIEPGTMKPTKMPALAMFIMFFCQMLFPFVMAPAFVPPLAGLLWVTLDWPAWVPVNLALSVILAALTAIGYWQSLAPLARLFARREHEILRRVTAGTE